VFGLCLLQQMAHAPGHGYAIALGESIGTLAGADMSGNVSGLARFFA
jgi:hypothetical protein